MKLETIFIFFLLSKIVSKNQKKIKIRKIQEIQKKSKFDKIFE